MGQQAQRKLEIQSERSNFRRPKLEFGLQCPGAVSMETIATFGSAKKGNRGRPVFGVSQHVHFQLTWGNFMSFTERDPTIGNDLQSPPFKMGSLGS